MSCPSWFTTGTRKWGSKQSRLVLNSSYQRRDFFQIGLSFQNFENLIKGMYLCPSRSREARSLSIVWTSRGRVSIPLVPINELVERYEAQEKIWLQSPVFEAIKENLLLKVRSGPTKVVGIGLGSVIYRHFDVDRILHQHAAVRSIANFFQKDRFGTKVLAYCQDPGYHEVDLELLDHIGLKHIKSPHGFLEVDKDSIIISISPDCPTKQIVADDQQYWPMAMIWDKVRSPEEETNMYAPMDHKN
jgi:hypothetical protein